MAYKKFLTSVADVYAYDSNDNILFVAKTLLDSSIEVSLGSTPVRGGRGNQLLYTYFHTAEMNFTITDTQWNLAMLGETVGSDFELGNYYAEENVEISASGSGVIVGTPAAFEGTTVYGWATNKEGTTQRVILNPTTGSFTMVGKSYESLAGEACVRYYTANTTEGREITISANILPSVVKLVMEAQLNSSDVTTNKIGIVQIIAPKVQLSGAFSLSMTSDGISNTPLTGMALAYVPSASSGEVCTSAGGYYAKIVEIIDNTNWYDNVYDLSVSGGDFALGVGETENLVVYAIPEFGSAFKVNNEDLNFSSSQTGSATVTNTTPKGIVTGVASGSSLITIYATSASAIDTTVTVTVTA